MSMHSQTSSLARPGVCPLQPSCWAQRRSQQTQQNTSCSNRWRVSASSNEDTPAESSSQNSVSEAASQKASSRNKDVWSAYMALLPVVIPFQLSSGFSKLLACRSPALPGMWQPHLHLEHQQLAKTQLTQVCPLCMSVAAASLFLWARHELAHCCYCKPHSST